MQKQKLILLLFMIMNSLILSQTTRPIRDSVGYCWNTNQFDKFIEWLDQNCSDNNPDSQNLVAGISPHDDYLYAGKIYHPLYKLIHTKEVVIFGLTHGTVRKEMNDPRNVLILDEFDKWQGPYNDVEVSPLRELIKQKLNKQYYIVSNKAQSIEHSIEGLIPFLQHYNQDVKITPIMVTGMPFERMDSLSDKLAGVISGYVEENNLKLGKDIFFLISNDANHYGEDFANQPYGLDENAHTTAIENDKRIADETFNGLVTQEKIRNFSDELWPEVGVNKCCPLWCGRYPIVFGLLTINKIVDKYGETLTGKLFKYSDTMTGGVLPFKDSAMGITAPYSFHHWVGFLSAGFYSK
jgi:MEMO1 family protein